MKKNQYISCSKSKQYSPFINTICSPNKKTYKGQIQYN